MATDAAAPAGGDEAKSEGEEKESDEHAILPRRLDAARRVGAPP